MANVIINDTNLTNIANAIREKNGTTTTYKPSEMADAITNLPTGGGGGYEPTDEELTYSQMASIFNNGNNAWVLNNYGDRIVFTSSNNDNSAFSEYPYETFNVNPKLSSSSQVLHLDRMFNNAENLKEITGTITSTVSISLLSTYMAFASCYNLRTINDNFIDNSWYIQKRTGALNNRFGATFGYCYSLRELPKFFIENMKTADGSQPTTNNASTTYANMFMSCSALNKIEDLFVVASTYSSGNLTSNMFSGTFNSCYNLSKLTFATNEDGTPLTAKWTNQIIDLYRTSASIGFLMSGQSETQITGYNSGFTAEDEIEGNTSNNFAPDAQYYIGDGVNKYWTADGGCAKYGHTEAVETINSLPDTLAAGGGNTISFYSRQGKFTDYLKGRTNDITFDSSIGTLTEAEIAVATAKGWTVSLNT